MPFTLVIAKGARRGGRFRFAAAKVEIGRGPENDLVLNDAAVSRAHARIERRGTSWVLLDRASANGTRLNGAALDASTALRDGDRIGVGAVTFEFRVREEGWRAAGSRSRASVWWSRLAPPARAGLIAGGALVAVASSGAASWRSEAAGTESRLERPGVRHGTADRESDSAAPPAIAGARAAYERGRRKLEERRIAPRNLYDAWRAFREARARLERVDGEALLHETVAQAIAHCEHELEVQCRRLVFNATRFERYGQEDKAQQAWREVLQHFPGGEATACRKKARESLLSAQPDDGSG